MDSSFLSLRGRQGSSSGVLLGLIGVLALLAILFLVGRNPPTLGAGITLYYGEGCPHCKIVDEFIAENKVEQKVSFEKKEVWSNTANAREMAERAKVCGVPTEGMGVPFLWTGSGCLTGDKDIIDFFQKKL